MCGICPHQRNSHRHPPYEKRSARNRYDFIICTGRIRLSASNVKCKYEKSRRKNKYRIMDCRGKNKSKYRNKQERKILFLIAHKHQEKTQIQKWLHEIGLPHLRRLHKIQTTEKKKGCGKKSRNFAKHLLCEKIDHPPRRKL